MINQEIKPQPTALVPFTCPWECTNWWRCQCKYIDVTNALRNLWIWLRWGLSVVAPKFPFPASTLETNGPKQLKRQTGQRVKEHGIWGVILFVFGVTCSTELGLSATVWKFIRGTNSSLIVFPSGEQSVSPAECWRGDRLLQDDNWKESGWSSLAPVALWDGYIQTPACFGGGQITECYIWRNDYVLLGLIWQT